MNTWRKIGIGAGVAAILAGGWWFASWQINKGVVTVQTAPVVRQDLTSVVTASGEVKPLTYTNVLGEGIGKITEIVVKEGDEVKKGDVLLRLESVQPRADVEAQRASIQSAEAGIRAAQANDVSAQADIKSRAADLEHAKLNWQRGQALFKAGLIPKQDYDTQKAAFDSAVAALASAKARAAQGRAQLSQARSALEQSQAMLARLRDVLRKTTYTAPINGVVTYIAVRVGENVVPGIQNATGSYLMTISDMSVVTSEVMVDETDIASVRVGEQAEVTIDALPGKYFAGKVTEVGTQAVLRSSGLASTQSTTGNQEAKDFKVVVTLQNPPKGLRPGLSSTAKIITAHKKDVLTIPIQALAMRMKKELQEAAKRSGNDSISLAADHPASDSASAASPLMSVVGDQDEVQGIFVVRSGRAVFVPVATGIIGVTDIEVLNGVQAGDQVITGSYKALRTLKPDARVKVDNSPPKVTDES
ncbi:MAG TPA: efflux RND transporter periplasmic adaptor subunit [Candidatus Dormibacteraeota bacterium]|nr:efflux RND transporter periplasmic adaptor subunit [Candidatus Dormibacteraeota bacterium]